MITKIVLDVKESMRIREWVKNCTKTSEANIDMSRTKRSKRDTENINVEQQRTKIKTWDNFLRFVNQNHNFSDLKDFSV